MNIHTRAGALGIVGALLLSAVFLTACSGSNKQSSLDSKSETTVETEQKSPADSKSAASSIDPLILITKADAEALFGERIKEPKGSNGDESLGQQIVIYGADSETSFKTVTFSLIRTADIAKEERDKGRDAAHAFVTTKEQFPSAKPVPGIGGSAFWDGPQGGWTGLNVLSKDTYFTIKVNLGTDVTSDTVELNAEKGLALKVLERLPKEPLK